MLFGGIIRHILGPFLQLGFRLLTLFIILYRFRLSITQYLLYLYNRGAPSSMLFGGVVRHVLEHLWPNRFRLLTFLIILCRFRLFPSSVAQHLTYLYNKEAPSLTVLGGVFRHVLDPFWPFKFHLLTFLIILYRFRFFPLSVTQHLIHLRCPH